MDINQEYIKYRFLADWIALKIYKKSTLPQYIKDDFLHVAAQSLIQTLNKYHNIFKEPILTKKHRQILKNRIGWDIIDAINKYHVSYVGVKTLITQKKHKLYPTNQDDQAYNDYNPTKYQLIDTNDPRQPIIDKEHLKNYKSTTKRLFQLLNIKQPQQDILLLNYTAYQLKYNSNLTYKQYDNLKIKLKTIMRQRIMQDEKHYRNKLELNEY